MIHQYINNGYHIVLDVNSGSVHSVDALLYDAVEILAKIVPDMEKPMPLTDDQKKAVREALVCKYSAEDIEDALSDIQELIDAEELFAADIYKDYVIDFKKRQTVVKALCLHIAHDCNLRCEYCFASTGDFGEGRKLMPLETGKQAIDFLLKHSANRKNLELDFFGGEPLMNFEVVKQVVAYARSKEQEYGKHFRFTITTNGMLLNDDNIDFINKEMSNVVLSIDGRKAVNDRMRKRVDGKGSYDIILPKYQRLVAQRGDKEYYVRGTYTKYNLDFSNDVFDLLEHGFDQISVEPVMADENDPYAITEADLPAIFKEYEVLMNKILDYEKTGKKFNFFHFMLDLDQGPCAIKRLRGCGCGNEYVAITPDGDIYPCHQFVGMEEWKMGNLEEGTFDQAKKADFAKAHIYTKPDCRECWARFYCSGGCNANNYQYAGDIRKAHKLSCEIEKKRLECAIVMKAIRMEQAEQAAAESNS